MEIRDDIREAAKKAEGFGGSVVEQTGTAASIRWDAESFKEVQAFRRLVKDNTGLRYQLRHQWSPMFLGGQTLESYLLYIWETGEIAPVEETSDYPFALTKEVMKAHEQVGGPEAFLAYPVTILLDILSIP